MAPRTTPTPTEYAAVKAFCRATSVEGEGKVCTLTWSDGTSVSIPMDEFKDAAKDSLIGQGDISGSIMRIASNYGTAARKLSQGLTGLAAFVANIWERGDHASAAKIFYASTGTSIKDIPVDTSSRG